MSFTQRQKPLGKHSQIGWGYVRHRRYVGQASQFQYNTCMMLVDLAELPSLFKRQWLWSVNKFNYVSFKRRCYLGDPKQSLFTCAKQLINSKYNLAIDRIELLTNFAYFGHCFNPISLYFCYQKNQLSACIAEVTNTPWGESKAYVLQPKAIKNHDSVYQAIFQKQLHVSPFMTMDYCYQLKFKYNTDKLIVHIANMQNNQCHFDATLSLDLQAITANNLAKTLWRFPFMSGKVSAAIYWQALKLWLSGNRYIKKPDVYT